MLIKKVTFRILRFKPGHIDPPRYQNFELEILPNLTVLDCLEKIRLEQANTLMYRHSCHHSSCGTCACKINGKEGLACITKVYELNGEVVTIAPLEGFICQGDLVVDMKEFFYDFSEDWTYLKEAESRKSNMLPHGIQRFTRLENCIECGACVSACPVKPENEDFIGPAVLSAIHNELQKSSQLDKKLLSLAGKKRGVNLCESALNCSRVCPTGVYPARHIADLRKLLANKNLEKTKERD
jgi:succinate dehydrogenase / fumarate reductase iron-sulfur subunit